jgi:molybdopterin molybdotransferase
VSRAVAGTALRTNDHRADHLRATISIDSQGRIVATPFPVQDSAMLHWLAMADALILRPPHALAQPEGTEVPVIRLDSLGI